MDFLSAGVLISVLCILLFLVFVIIIRTLRFTSKQMPAHTCPPLNIDASKAATNLSAALRFKTISYEDNAHFDGDTFLAFHRYLEKAFPKVHNTLTNEVVGQYSLLYTWRGSNDKLKPVMLMAHMDVVPIDDKTREDWVHDPFQGTIADGYIWGRGAVDDKSYLIGILEAFEALLADGFRPQRTIYLASGHDEELGGLKGNFNIMSLLQSRGVRLEYVLDEGLIITQGMIPGVDSPIAMVGISEKGYVSIELNVKSQGGHSSMPNIETSAGMLCRAVDRLERYQCSTDMKGPARLLFEYLGPHMPFAARLAFANLWIFRRLIIKKLVKNPATNAMVRTTTAPTMLEGSIKENILPQSVKAVINFRILPGNTVEGIFAHVKNVVNDPRVKIRVLGKICYNPSPISKTGSLGFGAIQKTVSQVFPGAITAPALAIVSTDSRHYSPICDSIYRFAPIIMSGSETKMIHGVNERISVESYARMIRFYIQLILNSQD